mgnify:CR=1 FL=1
MKIDVDLPKFDIPKDFIVGDGIMAVSYTHLRAHET